MQAVEDRIFGLSEKQPPSALHKFVETALLCAPGATVIMFLARSGVTRECLAAHLQDKAMLERLRARAEKSIVFGAGIAAAAAFVLDEGAFAEFNAFFEEIGLKQLSKHIQLVDSFAMVPSQPPVLLTGTVTKAPSRKAARHRLIIANSLKNITRLSLLFAEAEKVTLFSPKNLYGRLSIDEKIRLHARPDEILVAHPRSRATRFSQAYHSLHDETRQIAEEVIAEIDHEVEGQLAEAKPYLALQLADALFFKRLPLVGLQELIADQEFDQVLVVGEDDAANGFLQQLAGIIELQSDPRVEFVSLASSDQARIQFACDLATIFRGSQLVSLPSLVQRRPLLACLSDLRLAVQSSARNMRLWTQNSSGSLANPRPRVLFVTSPNSTYDTSSATYADILFRHFDTLIGLVGQNAAAIFNSVPTLPIPPADRVQLLSVRPVQAFPALDYAVQQVIERIVQRHDGPDGLVGAWQNLREDCASLSQTTIVVGLHHWERLLSWFGYMAQKGQKPDVLALSPLRPALVGMTAAAARRFAIPSIALEPHTINAEYCRYTRVMTDRYGAVSNYLAALAVEGFSIPAERIDVIGSPRLVAKKPVLPDAARHQLEAEGRAHFPQGYQTIVFFSQPSKWEQTSGVWQLILSAIKPLENMQILLKVHPEETESRIVGYLAIADALGLGNRVQQVAASPDLLIEAADLVLACYSATLVEAALAGRPVFSVANKGQRYPLGQHEVVGAPQYDDVNELSAALREFSLDPSQCLARLAQFMKINPQLVDGPEIHLCAAIEAMAKAAPDNVLRPAKELPARLFIEGPFRTYDV